MITESCRKAIRVNILASINRIKRQGTTGMSMANLFQITCTTGVHCPVPLYRSTFEQIARDEAKKKKFNLY